MNGAFGPVSSRLPVSTVTIWCVAGYVSPIMMLTCEGTLMWSPDPENIVCASLTTPTPTNQPTREFYLCIPLKLILISPAPPMNCTDPLSPPQNGTISDPSVPAIPGTQVTYQCNDGLFPEGVINTTCLATGEWNMIPGEIVCRNEPSKPPDSIFITSS